jgi:cytochrome c oxidase assembly protein subunit 15
MEPGWRNLFENTSWIAFLHRWTGVALALGGGGLAAWLAARAATRAVRLAAQGLGLLLVVQVLLGIATTLLSRGSIPVGLGTLHQTNALALLALTLFVLHAARPHSSLPGAPEARR